MRIFTRNNARQKGATDTAVLVAFCLLFLCSIGSFIYFAIFGNPPINERKLLQQTADTASSVRYYTADVVVQTEGNASTTDMISGTVAFDTVSETESGTFSMPIVPGKSAPKVKIENLSFSDAQYAKFTVKDPKNQGTTTFPEEWVMISASEKGPDQFAVLRQSLAFADIFELFQKGGRYLVIDGTAEQQIGGTEPEIHFVLRPSKIETDHPIGVSKNFDTILSEGKMNVWVSSREKNIRQVSFTVNGYSVKIKIKNSGKAITVEKPTGALSLSDWKAKQFSLFAPKKLVSEIFIGSYGSVNKQYLDAIASVVKKETGITATILVPGTALPEQSPLYKQNRRQFDAANIFESVKSASAKYGDSARFVYVLDVPLYSSMEKNRDSVWYADEMGTNTSLMSLRGLLNMSDASNTPAQQPIVTARAQKIALHILGTSVGFGLSPSAENPTCLMYKTNSLAELDKEGSAYCSAEKGVISKFFGK